REVWFTGTSVSDRPCTMTAGLPRRLPFRLIASMLARTVVDVGPLPVYRSRRQRAPVVLKFALAAVPGPGVTDAASTAAPPIELLLMMLMKLVGGTQLQVQ